jgi:hypothetical protein
MTAAKAAWPTVTGLIGVLIGAYIANRNQKKQWFVDNAKQEYRELMTALNKAFSAVLDETTPGVGHGPEEQRAFARAKAHLVVTIGDRILIARELREIQLLNRWQTAVRDFHKMQDETVFTETFVAIKGDLLQTAMRLYKAYIAS